MAHQVLGEEVDGPRGACILQGTLNESSMNNSNSSRHMLRFVTHCAPGLCLRAHASRRISRRVSVILLSYGMGGRTRPNDKLTSTNLP